MTKQPDWRRFTKEDGISLFVVYRCWGNTVITGNCPVCQMFPCEHNDVSGNWKTVEELAEKNGYGTKRNG